MLYNIKSIKRQSYVQIGFSILTTVSAFFATMLFSQILGAELMGVYYLFVTYFSIFNLLGDGGLGVAAVKKISEGKECDAYFSAYSLLRFILLILSTVVFLALFSFLPHPELAVFVIIALLIASVMNIVQTNIIAKDKISLANCAKGAGEMGRIIFSVIAVLFGFSIFGMLGGFIISLLITLIICFKGFFFSFAKFKVYHVKILLTFALWAMINSSATLLMGYADVLFIGIFMNTSDVGIYRIVLALASLVVFISTAIITTLPPKVSNWYENNEIDKIETVVSKSITWSLFLGVPLLIGGSILGEKLLFYFYGAEFSSGFSALVVLFIFYLLGIFTSIIAVVLVNSNKVKAVAIGTIIALGINIVVNFLLIHSLGILGVALSTLISQVFLFIWLICNYRKIFMMKLHYKNIGKIIVSSLIMGALVVISGLITHYDGLIITTVTVVAGAIVYFGLMLVLTKKFKTLS